MILERLSGTLELPSLPRPKWNLYSSNLATENSKETSGKYPNDSKYTMSYISICSNKSPLPCEASSGQLTTSHDQFQRSGPHFSAVAVPLRDACFDEARWNSWLGGGCYDNGDGYGMGMSQILKENLRLFSFFLFLLFFLPYLFEDQSVPWYAIKKRLKKHPELSGRVM